MAQSGSIGYGLIGAGGFGRFCLEQYGSLDGLRRVAVADQIADAAQNLAADFRIEALSVEALLERPDIDLVHLATPPWTHHELAMKAIDSGKHVLCEKPLAVTVEDGRAMVAAACEHGRVLAANLIMRYDPLCEAVKRIVEERLLGEPLHGFFENYAQDENLGPDHWFWDREKSGGIFIEHAVHFFDLYAWWLAGDGYGQVEAAQHVVRPGSKDVVEQVQATVRYGDAVLVNFYHGFVQSDRMERQDARLVFERGTIELEEWVPTRMRVHALATEADADRLQALIPHAERENVETYQGEDRVLRNRHRRFEVDGRYRFAGHTGMPKPELYGHVVRALLTDQMAAIRDPSHARRIDETNALRSLEMAAQADAMARGEAV